MTEKIGHLLVKFGQWVNDLCAFLLDMARENYEPYDDPENYQ